MRVASRFAIAVHILSLLAQEGNAGENTSEWMAGSIGANPVVVRSVSGMLRRAGLVTARQGVAGTRIARPPGEITLLDIYRAVGAVEEGELFAIHSSPNPACEVGANIQTALTGVFREAQQAMENRLATTTLEQLVREMRQKA